MALKTEEIVPRAITDEEVATFKEQGWVKFDQLISTEGAGVLLSRLQEIMGVDGSRAAHPASPDCRHPEMSWLA